MSKTQFGLFLLVFFCCGYFFNHGGWHQSARYDAIYSAIESGTPEIRSWLPFPEKNFNTGDWARHDGRYFSNKAPGNTLPGIAVYAPGYWAAKLIFGSNFPVWLDLFFCYLINLGCSALWTAFGAVFLFRLLRLYGSGERMALVWAAIYALATPLWPYSTQMWGAPMSASCEIFALYALARRRFGWGGFWTGMALLSDYMAIAFVPVAVMLAFCGRDWRRGIRFLGGALPVALLFALYHWYCFGSPFRPATFANNPEFLTPGATGGVATGFSLTVLIELLFGRRRGIFYQVPILLVCVAGAWTLWRAGGDRRRRMLLFAAAALAMVGLNASFNGWHGGYSSCARYLIPALPLLVLIAAAWRPRCKMELIALGVLAVLSLAHMLILSAVAPGAAETVPDPLFEAWRMWWSDQRYSCNLPRLYGMSPSWPEAYRLSRFSLGELVGLSGKAALLPLFAVAAALVWFLARSLGRCPRK